MSSPNNADQIAYWNGDAGARWVAQQARLDAMLSPISDAALKAANVQHGEHILDIGCGCGDTSIKFGKLGARVTGADISAPMLGVAKRRTNEANATATFIEADAATHKFDSNSFDLLFSRFGVMFFADPDAAFANMRKALKPTGRAAFVCWRDWRENEWVRVPIMAVRPHVPPQPQMGPEDPGPFAFADPARVRRILANGGFDAITLNPFDTKVEIGNTLDDAVTYLMEFGPISRALTDASPSQREQATNALRDALAPHAKAAPITLGAAVWIVTAKA
ncbi:MAG: class I SAM-dependent methyltransferase [Alphaproteobacteria bacterium]|nr:class I SAM-dependent methyltransferase [Alphaproteobacteria bacterium]